MNNLEEAVREIERLKAEIERLRSALEIIATTVDHPRVYIQIAHKAINEEDK
jgi:hypothetical protein